MKNLSIIPIGLFTAMILGAILYSTATERTERPTPVICRKCGGQIEPTKADSSTVKTR